MNEDEQLKKAFEGSCANALFQLAAITRRVEALSAEPANWSKSER